MKNSLKFLTVGVTALALAGCSSRRLSQGSPQYMPPPPPPGIASPPPGAIIVQPGQLPPGAIPQGSVPPPPGAFPTAPPQSTVPAAPPFPASPQSGPTSQFPTAPPQGPAGPPSASIPADVRDRVGFRWEPAAPPVPPPPAPPTPPVPDTKKSDVLLLPPVPDTGGVPKQEPAKPAESPEPPRAPAASPLPVGIAFYGKARENITIGHRPSLEGLDWLQKTGVKTVVYLHRPGEATDADKQQVEKRGMTFFAIEVDPKGLTAESVDRFMKLQTENRNEKVFVYDLDGSLSGAMWYLSFRLIDQSSDEVARIRSGPLGQDETREAAREVWQAARKFADSR